MEIKSFYSSSTGNLYSVSDGQSTVLLECGVSIQKIKEALNFKLSSVSGCLLTHEHKDHSKAAKDLIQFGIPVYSSAGTFKALELDGGIDIKPLHPFFVGSFKITPFETQHDAKEPLGFLIQSGEEKLLFATDTFYIRYKFL